MKCPIYWSCLHFVVLSISLPLLVRRSTFPLAFLCRQDIGLAGTNTFWTSQFGYPRPDWVSSTRGLGRCSFHVRNCRPKSWILKTVVLDVSKASDKVWHKGLIDNLLILEYPLPLVRLIHCFLHQRQFRVKLCIPFCLQNQDPIGFCSLHAPM